CFTGSADGPAEPQPVARSNPGAAENPTMMVPTGSVKLLFPWVTSLNTRGPPFTCAASRVYTRAPRRVRRRAARGGGGVGGPPARPAFLAGEGGKPPRRGGGADAG